VPYVDLNTVHNPSTGSVAPASWGDQIRDNFEFLIDPPACSVSGSGAQSVANNTLTALSAATENYDNASMHSTVTNNSRIASTVTGLYEASAVVDFAGFGSGSPNARLIEFRVDGTTVYGAGQYPDAGNLATTQIYGSRTMRLTSGSYVETRVRHQAGGALNVTLNEFWLLFRTR
jgi:hypothetical protein